MAPLLGGPRSSRAPVHWTAWTPGSYATEVTYRAISDYFLILDVAFFSHWRLEAHIPQHCHPEYWWGHSHWCPHQPKYWWGYVPGIPGGVDAYAFPSDSNPVFRPNCSRSRTDRPTVVTCVVERLYSAVERQSNRSCNYGLRAWAGQAGQSHP